MASEKLLVVDADVNICELLRLYLTKACAMCRRRPFPGSATSLDLIILRNSSSHWNMISPWQMITPVSSTPCCAAMKK